MIGAEEEDETAPDDVEDAVVADDGAEEESADLDQPADQEPVDESGLTSINVTADDAIYVTITVDGSVVFDDDLAAGESTGYVTGNTFEVYTTWGEKTIFTDACGDEFLMGYDTGEATYPLQKQPDSCAPID